MLLDIIGLAEFTYFRGYNAFVISGFILASEQAVKSWSWRTFGLEFRFLDLG